MPRGLRFVWQATPLTFTLNARPNEALRDSERLFRALFEETTTAVTLRDLRGRRLIDCNRAALKLYACESVEQLRSLTPVDLAPPLQPDGQSTADLYASFIDTVVREGSLRAEWIAMRTTGELFPADVRVSVITLEGGRQVMQVMVDDITERKRAEAAMAKSKEDAIAASMMKSAFIANMSHELRTPLNGVIGMVDLLATTKLDEKQRRYTEVARSSASLLLSVINDILDFSRSKRASSISSGSTSISTR